MPIPKRRQSEAAGRRAETLACWRLRLAGYRILGRRVKSPLGELDIVARRGSTLVFVEVKTRAHLRDALESVTTRQRQRIARAAEAYIAGRPDLHTLDVRFDVMMVPRRAGNLGFPRHLKDAWRP